MKRLVAFLVLVLSVCALPARAALVYDGYPTGPGGLSTPYPAANPEVYAGYIQMNLNGVSVLAISDDYNARSNVGESWPMTLYTYADVMAGAPVRFDPVKYSQAAVFSDGAWWRTLLNQVSNGGVSQRWFYGSVNRNIAIWNIMNPGSVLFPNPSDSFYQNGEAQMAYDYAIDGTHDDGDWSTRMLVASGGPGRDEYLIPLYGQNITLASGTIGPVVPVPPAFWLLGSGLLGLVGVARKKHKAPH